MPPEDKLAYRAVFDELLDAAQSARAAVDQEGRIVLKPMRYSPQYGSRGHRPVDLWVSLCGADADAFGQMPQVYAIASERGLEVGFAVSIDEADYYMPAVKARNRTFVPLLNAKLPAPSEGLTQALDQRLAEQGGWHFNTKTRLKPGDPGCDRYGSLAELLTALKGTSKSTGGGTVCRLFPIDNLEEIDAAEQFELALRNFLPLISRCSPTPWDLQILGDQNLVSELAEQIPFDPDAVSDDRRKVLAEVARRQGQAAFRRALFRAYDGCCAISGTSVPSVLQAAHITPYLGSSTNDVTNGLLLRADLHTLFDLHLLKIDPETLLVMVADSLKETPYADYNGLSIRLPLKAADRPSSAALRRHFLSSQLVRRRDSPVD